MMVDTKVAIIIFVVEWEKRDENMARYTMPGDERLVSSVSGRRPLQYTADLLDSKQRALSLYGPMHLLYSAYDVADDKDEIKLMWEDHLRAWTEYGGTTW